MPHFILNGVQKNGKRSRVMYKDDETRRVLYEVLLEQCFEKMPEEEKAKWIRKEQRNDTRNQDTK